MSHCLSLANFKSLTAIKVSTSPTARPMPICSTTSFAASGKGPISPAVSRARARKSSKTGTQIPSLRPLSTFRLWRISSGTASLVITALPKAASVGASMVAKTASANKDGCSMSRVPNAKPSAIVSGNPINSSLAGTPVVFFSTLTSAPAASVNSTIASVTSARLRMSSRSVSQSSRARPAGPISSPKQVNTMGPLILVRSTAPATEL